MFLETLRQAKHLGIIRLLEQGSPIKTKHQEATLMADEIGVNQYPVYDDEEQRRYEPL